MEKYCMNRILKQIVPILMVIAILACIGWYLFVYDRTFTRDMLVNLARVTDMQGNPELASFFYNRAYEYSGNDEDVAIELAHQYIGDRNYTKAEYTLSTAIANDPSVSLYVALSKVYVAQDKLLDAVNLLDNITDPALKSQLDFLRPKAPAAMPEPGFYNQYIPVTLTSEVGTIYYNTKGEYPTTEDAPFSEELILPGGETTIYAVTVSQNGLVSPVTILAYTVGGVIEPAIFTDAAVEAEVRQILGVEADDALYTNDLWAVTDFTVPEEAQSIEDLKLLPYLKTLAITNKKLESLAPLTNMFQLSELILSGCRFPAEDLAVLTQLPELARLSLSGCGLSTIEGLTGAPKLSYLDLSNNTVRNLTALSEMATLKELYLQHNAVVDLSALSSLANLENLDVSYNSLSSLAALASCTSLRYLHAGNNAISNLTGLDILPNLEYLNLNNNKVSDAAILGKCTGLKELHIAYNMLKNITMLSSLMELEVLDFSHNTVYEIPYWPEGSPLRIIDGSYNELKSVDTLWNMKEMTYIYMDYNKITSLSNLVSMPKLVQINAYGNPIEDLTGLEARHIIVNYDPTQAK